MEEKLDEVIALLKSIDNKLKVLISEKETVKIKKPSTDAILKQYEETEKLFNKIMSRDK